MIAPDPLQAAQSIQAVLASHVCGVALLLRQTQSQQRPAQLYCTAMHAGAQSPDTACVHALDGVVRDETLPECTSDQRA